MPVTGSTSHDYRGPRRSAAVYHALNTLSEQLPLVQIDGTSLVAYRSPRREEPAAAAQLASREARG
jgi:hypothetical protein